MVLVKPDQRDELAALAAPRDRLYSFLSAAFAAPPAPTTLAAVRAPEFLDATAEVFSERTVAALRLVAESCASAEGFEREARQEFMNLFKVPGGQYVPPYESVFRDARDIDGRTVSGLLMGPSAMAVQQWYRLGALDISPEWEDLPDHIALELAYLAHLCAKEQEFASGGQEGLLGRAWEMERDFLAAHVVSWAGAMSHRIQSKTSHPYFLAVAALLVEFTQSDLITLENLLGPSQGRPLPDYQSRCAVMGQSC